VSLDAHAGVRLSGFGFGFRVLGFGFRVSGFGFRVSGFGFRVPGSGFRVSGFGVVMYPGRHAGSTTAGTDPTNGKLSAGIGNSCFRVSNFGYRFSGSFSGSFRGEVVGFGDEELGMREYELGVLMIRYFH